MVTNNFAFNADPMTHLLASWRYSEVPRFVCGQFGFEMKKQDSTFICAPVAPLNMEPWADARVDRLQQGIWMLHAENSLEGVGLFLGSRDCEYSTSQMKIPKTTIRSGLADRRFLNFIEPLWPTIDQMVEAYWRNPIMEWETQFEASIELMRRFKGARELYAVTRLRDNHPYLAN